MSTTDTTTTTTTTGPTTTDTTTTGTTTTGTITGTTTSDTTTTGTTTTDTTTTGTETLTTESLVGKGKLEVCIGGFRQVNGPSQLYNVSLGTINDTLYATPTTHCGASFHYGFDQTGTLEVWYNLWGKVTVTPETPTHFTLTTTTITDGMPIPKPHSATATVVYHP